jgi:hypothetical protein
MIYPENFPLSNGIVLPSIDVGDNRDVDPTEHAIENSPVCDFAEYMFVRAILGGSKLGVIIDTNRIVLDTFGNEVAVDGIFKGISDEAKNGLATNGLASGLLYSRSYGRYDINHSNTTNATFLRAINPRPRIMMASDSVAPFLNKYVADNERWVLEGVESVRQGQLPYVDFLLSVIRHRMPNQPIDEAQFRANVGEYNAILRRSGLLVAQK